MKVVQHHLSQAIKVGTYDEVFGPGSTPLWALPTDVMKYQDTQLVEDEAGFVLDYKVICRMATSSEDNVRQSFEASKVYVYASYCCASCLGRVKVLRDRVKSRRSLQEPAVFQFINSARLNAWGQPKGYGIFHGGTSTQLLPSTHPLTK